MDTPGDTIFAPETLTDPPDKVTDWPLSARTRILPGSSVCTTTPAEAPCRMVAVTPFDTTTSPLAGLRPPTGAATGLSLLASAGGLVLSLPLAGHGALMHITAFFSCFLRWCD